MEKINIAELLKDCPKGMELDSTMYDNLYFDSLDADYNGIIICYTLISGIKTSIGFTKYGTFNNHMGAKCVIFPKGKTTWEGFIPPYFKVGDVVQDVEAYKVKITEVDIENYCYVYESVIAKGIGSINFSEQDNWKLASNKFDINTLVPFENKVLVRDGNTDTWRPNFWGFYNDNNKNDYPYACCGTVFAQCIPYEGNEHLLGKIDDCDEYYKTWE